MCVLCVQLNAGKDAAPDKNLSAFKKRVQDCLMYERKLSELEQQMVEYDVPVPAPLPEHVDRKHQNKDNTVLPEIKVTAHTLLTYHMQSFGWPLSDCTHSFWLAAAAGAFGAVGGAFAPFGAGATRSGARHQRTDRAHLGVRHVPQPANRTWYVRWILLVRCVARLPPSPSLPVCTSLILPLHFWCVAPLRG
jgi:hypothetical protein